MAGISGLDWTVCGLYLGVVFGLAICSSWGQRDNEEYFIGGRRMNWLLVGISMFATSFSAISFLGLPERGAYQDLSFYVVILGIPLIITPVLWWIFVPLYFRLGVSSGYEYLGLRFGPAVRKLGSILYAAYAIGWMGTMLHGVALTLQVALGVGQEGYLWMLLGVGLFSTVYTTIGGFRAVVWTDGLQALTLGGAILAVFWLTVGGIDGGWSAMWRIGSEGGRLQMFHLDIADPLAASNFTDRSSVYSALAFALFMYLPGYTVSQNMIQRYVCTGSLRRGRAVVVLSALVNSVLGLVFLLVGVALFAFYTQPGGPGLPAPGVELARKDQILPHFVASQASGEGVAGLVLAGLFAAAMSTMDSGINGVASVVVFDWLAGRRPDVRASRWLTVLLGTLVIGAALGAPLLGPTVLDIIMVISSMFLGLLLGVFLLGIFVPRANSGGALIGVAAGAASMIAAWRLADVPVWWTGAFAIVPPFLVGAAGSLLFDPPPLRARIATVYHRSAASSTDQEDPSRDRA